jgi:cyclase
VRPPDPAGRTIWRHEDGARRLSLNARALPGHSTWRRRRNRVAHLFGGRRVDPIDLDGGTFLRNEFLTLSTHSGTHLDAPYHYGPWCDGARAKRILDIPLEWCEGRGHLLDVRRFGPQVRADDVVELLAEGVSLAGSIVLFRTDSDLLLGSERYFTECPQITAEAVEVVLDLGAKVVGVDSWSLDGPALPMLEDYFEHREGRVLWPVHMLGRRREFLQLEGLGNLRSLPQRGEFTVCAFPIALSDSGGAWVRAVARVGVDEPPPG